MEDAIVSVWALAAMFLVVAAAYATVGLGGATAYTALLAVFGVSHVVIPTVSLTLNLVVTAVASLVFARGRHVRMRLILPFLVTSIPLAYVGGAIDVPAGVFYWILLVSLVLIAARIYLFEDPKLDLRLGRRARLALSLVAGAVLGLLAGIVGIGGGIYLVPLIIILGLGTEKEAAACGAVFVLVISAAGLASRLQHHPVSAMEVLPLAVAVLVGGLVGALLGSERFSPKTMQRVLGAIVLLAIVLLLRRVVTPS